MKRYNAFDIPALQRTYGGILALAVVVGFQIPAGATPPFGQTAQAFRGKFVGNINVNQWGSQPLFNLQAETSPDQWGYDLIQADAVFAPLDASGRPGTSGWHSHPVALAIIQVVQGTLWEQHSDQPGCVTPYGVGSVLVERSGGVHNIYNMDKQIPAIVRIIYIAERQTTATRTDEADPATGSFDVAGQPPTTICSDPASSLDAVAMKSLHSHEPAHRPQK